MATVTGLTAERMKEIENGILINAYIQGDNLILVTKDNNTINAGNVRGLPGPSGESVVFLDAGESAAGLPDGTKICRRYA